MTSANADVRAERIAPEMGSSYGEQALLTDLTSERSRFIHEAQRKGQHYIFQPYELYSDANHESWAILYARMQERWERYANQHFLLGIDRLRLNPQRAPRLEDVNRFLQPLTGFQAVPVSGFLPAFLFFNSLRERNFPTTITIREAGSPFAEWPDIFHDICGHVPMHTDPDFANALVRVGDCAHTAVEMVSGIRDRDEQVRRLTSIIQALARFFWFTIETGLMREGSDVKVYGSAMLSSYSEIDRVVSSQCVQKYPIQLEWVINQQFLPNHYQPLLFIVESFSHLYELVDELERWMRAGKLDHVAPGEPAVSEADLSSFLSQAENA